MPKRDNFHGIIPALATILDARGEIDEEGMRSQVRFNIQNGVHGLAPGIIGGEFYKFTEIERERVWKITIDEANSKVPVLVGVSHTGTVPSVILAKKAKDLGADGLIVMPPFFQATEATLALYEHFSTIAKSVDLPIMIQDAEDEIRVPILPSVYARLAKEHSNVTMAKVEGVNTLEKIRGLVEIAGDSIAVFGGGAARNLPEELRLGTKGNIPGCCLNDLVVETYNGLSSGQTDKATKALQRYMQFIDFFASYPLLTPNIERETLRLRGVIKSVHMRGPMLTMDNIKVERLKQILIGIGLIKA